jgi:hypothetical protein
LLAGSKPVATVHEEARAALAALETSVDASDTNGLECWEQQADRHRSLIHMATTPIITTKARSAQSLS